MTNEEINESLRIHVAALLERDTVSGKLPPGTEEEVQQLFNFLVSNSMNMIETNPELMTKLHDLDYEKADALIKWMVDESGKDRT